MREKETHTHTDFKHRHTHTHIHIYVYVYVQVVPVVHAFLLVCSPLEILRAENALDIVSRFVLTIQLALPDATTVSEYISRVRARMRVVMRMARHFRLRLGRVYYAVSHKQGRCAIQCN